MLFYLSKLATGCGCGLKQPVAAKTILADHLVARRIIDIDEHIFFRMAGEKSGEDFHEVFLFGVRGMHKTVADVEAMRPLCAIESNPLFETVSSKRIEPFTIVGDLRIDGLIGQVFSAGDGTEFKTHQDENEGNN